MYQDHFKLDRLPFRHSPDPDRYFAGAGHEAALAELRSALADGESLALIDAPPGLGKSLLGQILLRSAPETTRTVLLTNSHFTERSDLFAAALADLGVIPERNDEAGLRQALTEVCLSDYAQGGRTVVVVDEAHHLSDDLLEELRMWGNLEGPHGPAIQVVLIAQPQLRERLVTPGLASLNQRLSTRVRLEPFSPRESAEYVVRELDDVGVRPERLITREALGLLARGADGVPRVLCQLANKAFDLTAASGGRQVDAEAVIEAASRLGFEIPDEEPDEEPMVLPWPEPSKEPKAPRRRRETKKAAGN